MDNNAKVSYSIYESNGTRASETFDINPTTGEMYLKQNAIALGKLPFKRCSLDFYILTVYVFI